MYVIAIYDVEARRCPKVHKFLKKYLTWIQNSVFEGEVSDADFKIIKSEVKKKINKKEDSVIFYNLGSNKWLGRDLVGVERNVISNVI
jgi:CRISPR-associated protein Cas2